MTRFCFFLLLFFCSRFFHSQTISQFTWDSNPVTRAIIGPNATSVGSSATSSPGGVGGTNGLNPGLPKTDINLTVPNTGGVFDVPNIDVSIDYRRNESTASLVKRGVFTFNSTNNPGNFQVVYRVNNGTTAGLTITGGSYAAPNDNTFRNYRFTYDNCSGIGTMYVNNSAVWTSSATPNQNLYWVGDGNLIIGQDMDGNGNDIVNLDNFLLKRYTCSTLPIELVSFTGSNEGAVNVLKWVTASETRTDYFTIQRSQDGVQWSDLKQVAAAGHASSRQSYVVYDREPAPGINYYRLTQTDLNGQTARFGIVSLDNTQTREIRIVRMVDLLGRDVDESYEGLRLIYYSNGQVLKKTGL